ncbi:MAG TPA: SDR family oxidoreductase [Chromatiales bacterium]|nr:SDR family oxidoreductase [Chromatiales bacterium]
MNVLITGANRGIGLGFVQHYLAQGCDVWATCRSDYGGLADIDSPRLHILQWDVISDKDERYLQAMAVPDRLDLLINNAGIYGPKKTHGQSFETVTAETMQVVFEVNCVGALKVSQLLASRVISARGVIANISSKMGSSEDNSSGGCYAYRAAKAALVIVSRSMAVDLAADGVNVITLHPGWVSTDMTNHSGLIDVATSVKGLATVIENIEQYQPGAFVAFDGKVVPY